MVDTGSDVLVAGAGVMGLWTALHLRGRGLRVTVVDPWEPGHARATSSSESRIIRAVYGSDGFYTDWSWRALAEWSCWEADLGRQILFRTGVLWLAREDEGYESKGEAELRRQGIPVERLSASEVKARFPPLATEGIRFAILEPQAGVLLARESIWRLAEILLRRGGRILRGAAEPGYASGGRLRSVRCGALELQAETYVFACGPWLPKLFPDLLGQAIRVRRAEEIFFGVSPVDSRFDAASIPAWVEIGHYYGIPALEGQGLKVGADNPGADIDPTQEDRTASAAMIEAARAYVARRVPALGRAPVLDTRLCTYEVTADEQLLIDRHPDFENAWLVGGGSGHAFKLGPVIGDYVARLVTEDPKHVPHARFRLAGRVARPWRQA